MGNNMKAKKRVSLYKKQSVTGWAFLLPATLLIFAMNFYPMIQAFILSFKTGIGNNQTWGGLSNYARLLKRRRVPYCNYKQFLLSDYSGAGNADSCNFSGMSFK